MNLKREYADLTQAMANTHQSLAASGRLSKVERARHAARAAKLQSEAAHLRRALRAPKRQARAARAAERAALAEYAARAAEQAQWAARWGDE